MRKALLSAAAFAAAISLGACAYLDTKLARDAGVAEAYATANGDTEGAQCAGALQKAFTVPPGGGILTAVEKKRVLSGVVEHGACTPQAAQLLGQLLQNIPGVSGILLPSGTD